MDSWRRALRVRLEQRLRFLPDLLLLHLGRRRGVGAVVGRAREPDSLAGHRAVGDLRAARATSSAPPCGGPHRARRPTRPPARARPGPTSPTRCTRTRARSSPGRSSRTRPRSSAGRGECGGERCGRRGARVCRAGAAAWRDGGAEAELGGRRVGAGEGGREGVSRWSSSIASPSGGGGGKLREERGEWWRTYSRSGRTDAGVSGGGGDSSLYTIGNAWLHTT